MHIRSLTPEEVSTSKWLICFFYLLRPTSFQGRLLKHNLDSEVVDALKDLRNKLAENELKSR